MARILNIGGSPVTDRGISKLAEYVEANLQDFTLVIGCKPFVYDVDAVLIGKGNVYAIECKDWKGKITGGTYGWWQKDGQVIENPLQQARTNAAALGKWLRKNVIAGQNKFWIKGLLVFTHEESQLSLTLNKDSNTGVAVTNITNLKELIYNGKKLMPPEIEIKLIEWFNNYKAVYKSPTQLNRKNKKDYMTKMVLYISVGISLLFALLDRSGIGFIVFIFISFFAFVIRPLHKKYNKVESFEIKYIKDHDDTVTNPSYSSLSHNIFHNNEK
jgi:hypothetical protein